MSDFFKGIEPIRYEGLETANEFAFRHYDPEEDLNGKPLKDHLRFSVAWWHSFAGTGADPFGGDTFQRPWAGETMEAAKFKADVAFEFFAILGQPFFCFHDADVRPEGETFAESVSNLDEMTDYIGGKMEAAGAPKLLWGTANLFSHRRYMAGAATNPDPEVFAYAAATVKAALDATHRLGGQNYVLWGGREGYETLLNTDLTREREQAKRFLQIVVDYARKIGFEGQILIEPKPQEPTKHQYDRDVATVYGFLKDAGLEDTVKVNLENGHAFLAGHSFEHEIALARALGIFGSLDMNRNDAQSGWDTDQFPDNVREVALAYYEVLKGGGFTTGGTNFDAKIRRQSLDPADLVAAHVGAMDTCAAGFKAAAWMLEDGILEGNRQARYARWETTDLLTHDLEAIFAHAMTGAVRPQPRSGRQERLENVVSRYV